MEDLMEKIKDEIDAEFMDIVLIIEKLLEEFFVEEFVDGETTRPQTKALLNQLESSKIPKSKQHQIKMLLDDIEKYWYRVEQILQRLMDVEDKEGMLTVLKHWFAKDTFQMNNLKDYLSWMIQTWTLSKK